MGKIPKNTVDLASFVLRLGFGSFMLFGHGIGKFQMFFEATPKFPSVLGMPPMISLLLVIFAEFFAAAFVLVGFKTRLATIPVIVTMIIAAFIIHFNDPVFALNANGGGSKEFALLFLTGFVAIFLIGSGKYSVDAWFKAKGK